MDEWGGDEPIAAWIERAARNALANRATRPPRVVHERQIALPMARAYYEELSRRPAFATAIKSLFEEWSVPKAEQFSASWHLPPEGAKDLRHSHDLWVRRLLRRPMLVPGSRAFPGMPDSAELAEKWGYRVRPPRSASARDRARGARRLAERVVGEKSWYAIAGEESGQNYPRDTRALRTQVAKFAEELHITLPKRQPGRPPKTRTN